MIRILLLLLFVGTAAYSQDCQCDTLTGPKGFGYRGKAVKIADNQEVTVAATTLSMLQYGPDTVLRAVMFALATTKSRGSEIANITIKAQDGSGTQLTNIFQKQSRQSSREDGRNAEYAASYILTSEQLQTVGRPLQEITISFKEGGQITVPIQKICTKCTQLPFPPIKKLITNAIKNHEYECDVTKDGKDTDYRCRDSRFFEIQRDDKTRIYADVSATRSGKGKVKYSLGFLIKQSTVADIATVQVTTRDGDVLLFGSGIQGARNSSDEMYQFFTSYDITKKQLDTLSKPLKGFTLTFENGDIVEAPTLHICTECALKAK